MASDTQLSQPQPATEPDHPDVMNDPAFSVNQDGHDGFGPDTCRICRAEGSETEPLFHPCKCSGSIKFVHQDCLMAWLSHSNKKYCELCKASFRFTRLYKDDMPAALPWRMFVPRVFMRATKYALFLLRSCLALSVWLFILPYAIRYSWRSLFYMVDVEWARTSTPFRHTPLSNSTINSTTALLNTSDDASIGPLGFRISRLVLGSFTSFVLSMFGDTADVHDPLHSMSNHTRSSLLSDLKVPLDLTFGTTTNDRILDVLEGQLIVVIVIISWLVITLIRESIVQQQGAIAAAADLADARAHRNVVQAQAVAEDPYIPPLLDAHADQQASDAVSDTDTLEVSWSAASSQTDDNASLSDLEIGDVSPSSSDAADDRDTSGSRPPMPARDATPSVHEVHRFFEEAVYNPEASVDSTESAHVPLNDQNPLEAGHNEPDEGVGLSSTWSELAHECVDAVEVHQQPSASDDANDEILSPQGLDEPANKNNIDHFGETKSQQSDVSRPQDPSVPGDLMISQQTYEAPGPSSAQQRSDEPVPTTNEVSIRAHDASATEPEARPILADTESHEAVQQVVEQQVAARFERGHLTWLYDFFWREIELPDRNSSPPNTAANDIAALPAGRDVDHEPPEPAIIFDEMDPADDDGGLNVQAMDDAEDAEDLQGAIQGILELLGINGPPVLLLQATAFSGAFVTVNLWGIIGVPYMFGKLALLYLAHPIFFGVFVPLNMVKILVNVVSDAITCIFDLTAVLIALIMNLVTIVSSIPSEFFHETAGSLLRWALDDLAAVYPRLLASIAMQGASRKLSDSGFLLLSMTARQSLQEIKDEFAQILSIPAIAIVRLGSPATYQGWSQDQFRDISGVALASLRSKLLSCMEQFYLYSRQIYSGSLEVEQNTTRGISLPTDSLLTHWSATDRIFTTILGYALIGMLAAIYISAKPPLSSAKVVRSIELALATFIIETGLVFKVVLIIGTELITFPIFRGILMDIATIPIFGSASFESRLNYMRQSPYLATLLHWFLGMACTLNFGSFISMLRKKLRRGVLDFVKGPDDPDFHPVRVVLELSMPAQMKSLFSAALFYAVLILGGMGIPTWLIYWFGAGTLPIKWTYPEPSLEFPLGFVLYNIAIPWMLRYLKPMSYGPQVFDWWLRRAARGLRLSHFLFGNRQMDEERDQRLWIWRKLFPQSETGQGKFSGRYVQVPASDKARAPGERRVFKEVTEADVVTSEALLALKMPKPLWQAVYVPPSFKARLILFVLALWSLCFLIGFNITVTPLWTGRLICHLLASRGYRFGDTWAYTLGINLMLNLVCLVKFIMTNRTNIDWQSQHRPDIQRVWHTVCDGALRTFDMIWVYGGVTLLVPLLCAGVLQLYLLIPWQTYMDRGTVDKVKCLNPQWTGEIFASHSAAFCAPAPTVRLMLWPELSIGHFLGSTLAKMLWKRHHRLLEAVAHQVVRDGYLRPNRGLANRAVFAPLLLAMTVLFGGPMLLAAALDAITTAQLSILGFTRLQSVLLYRYSYPACALVGIVALLGTRVLRATTEWRDEVKSEMYLLGSKLHNWGETRPAAGSKALLMTSPEDTAAI